MIEREDTGGVAVLRMVHGAVQAMDLELVQAIGTTFRALATERPAAVVLTGTGRAFSAGADLRRYVDGGADYVRAFLPALSEAFLAVFGLGVPVVAAVNGHAIAGGCVLACCADLRIMADGSGRIGVPEIKVGVPFPRVPLEVMRYAVGDVVAGRLVLGAGTHLPRHALGMGLVDEVVEPDAVLPRALEAATRFAHDVPADTFAATKAQLHRDTTERIERYRDEDDAVTRLWEQHAADGWVERYLESVTRRGPSG